MNIAEILKNTPAGTELYSSTFGNVILREVLKNGRIEVMEEDGRIWRFYSNGNLRTNGECSLFPQRKTAIGAHSRLGCSSQQFFINAQKFLA